MNVNIIGIHLHTLWREWSLLWAFVRHWGGLRFMLSLQSRVVDIIVRSERKPKRKKSWLSRRAFHPKKKPGGQVEIWSDYDRSASGSAFMLNSRNLIKRGSSWVCGSLSLNKKAFLFCNERGVTPITPQNDRAGDSRDWQLMDKSVLSWLRRDADRQIEDGDILRHSLSGSRSHLLRPQYCWRAIIRVWLCALREGKTRKASCDGVEPLITPICQRRLVNRF